MFINHTKRKNFYLSSLRNKIFIGIIVVFLICFICYLSSKSSFSINDFLIIVYFSLVLQVVYCWTVVITDFYLRKQQAKEYAVDISETPLPAELPKVVYVYTTHNDFLPFRLQQNMQQTYKNLEIWISDGSDQKKYMDEIDEFCKTNPQIKLYRIGGEGSKNKADNLNHFLKNSQAKFDYLLFGDADEVIDKNFLNVAIRLFYCPKYSELGYITPINQTYKTNNMYTNCCKNANDFVLQQTCNNMYKLKWEGEMYGWSSLIKKEALDSIDNGLFPDSNVEDSYLTFDSFRKNVSGISLPFCVCLQEYDVSVKAFQSRITRCYNWIVQYWRKPIDNFNDAHKNQIDFYYCSKFILPLCLLVFGALVGTTIFVIDYRSYFLSKTFIPLFAVCISFDILLFLYYFIKSIGLKNALLFPFFGLPVVLSLIRKYMRLWIDSVFFNKYYAFGGTQKRGLKRNKTSWFSKIWKELLWFFGLSCIIAGSSVLYVLFDLGRYKSVFCLFVAVCIVTGFFWLSYLSEIYMFVLGFIKVNKQYKKSDFIYYHSNFVGNQAIADVLVSILPENDKAVSKTS